MKYKSNGGGVRNPVTTETFLSRLTIHFSASHEARKADHPGISRKKNKTSFYVRRMRKTWTVVKER